MDHELITFDEVGFRLVPVYRKVWFFKGEKPKGIFFWCNKKLNLIGALINGKKIFYEWHNSLNSLTFRAFLSSFIDTLSKKKKYVFLLDNAGYHKTYCITNFLASFENIKVEFYPPYSPELNAIETCWKIVRANVTNSTYFKSIEDMKLAIEIFLDNHFFKLNLSNYLCP
ncbi:MAG: IS630 family transposase [Candidatus Woesearchaeota archaeon]